MGAEILSALLITGLRHSLVQVLLAGVGIHHKATIVVLTHFQTNLPHLFPNVHLLRTGRAPGEDWTGCLEDVSFAIVRAGVLPVPVVREERVWVFSLKGLFLQELKEEAPVGVLPCAQDTFLQLAVR
jgi:hypothetical protein